MGYNTSRNPMKIILEVKSEWKNILTRKWSFSDQKIYFYCEFLKVTASFKSTVSYWLWTSVSFILLTTRILCEKFTATVSYNLVPRHQKFSTNPLCLLLKTRVFTNSEFKFPTNSNLSKPTLEIHVCIHVDRHYVHMYLTHILLVIRVEYQSILT